MDIKTISEHIRELKARFGSLEAELQLAAQQRIAELQKQREELARQEL